MEDKKVSIVIPCYNHAKYLSSAIISAFFQTHKNIEVIVVNDGSTDHTSKLAGLYKDVILIDQENKGLSGARNAGIARATGDYILPLDADDMILPEFIEKTIGVSDIVSTWQQEIGLSNRLWMNKMENPTYEDFIIKNRINCCALFKREIWEKIGGYDEQMRDGFEDWEFWIRATKAGYKVQVVPEALFLYRKHGESLVTHAIKNYQKNIDYMKSKNGF